MLIIIGLGNPGEKFEKTRHNLGFRALDFFAFKNNFSDFEFSKKYESLISQKIYSNILQNIRITNNPEEQKIILVKPQTFMNNSGLAVKKLTKSYPLDANPLIIIHDDIDLPLGKLKISKNSGAGGHKGVDSIINNLGKNDFIRFKIGICPEKGKPKSVESFVIKKFIKEELETIGETIKKTSDALNLFIKEGLEKTMNQFN